MTAGGAVRIMMSRIRRRGLRKRGWARHACRGKQIGGNNMKWSLYALALGACIDLIVGDPHGLPHPVVGIGKLISLLERLFRRICPKSRGGEIMAGACIWLCTAAVSAAVPAAADVSVVPAAVPAAVSAAAAHIERRRHRPL